jgi:clan AA aspartic protease (TIGR02281 family)
MRNSASFVPSIAVCLALTLPTMARADEVADSRAALIELGIRPLQSNMALEAEGAFAKELNRSLQLRRTLAQATKEQSAIENRLQQVQRALTTLKQQHIGLSAQLASINQGNVTLNNRLVGALNAMQGQMELGEQQKDALQEQIKGARAKVNEAREAYLQFVLDARQIAEKIEADYEAQPKDEAVKAAIERYNKASGKQLALTPTNALAVNLRRLSQLEDTILSESITLTSEGGTLKVNVVVGKQQHEMVVDSGASLISLPLAVAAKFGLRPSEKDPRIILSLADGREIMGHKMTLPSVRVGKFTVENVECAVLGEEAVNAEPLLGMSFLEHFKFELDAASKTLTMVKVAGN